MPAMFPYDRQPLLAIAYAATGRQSRRGPSRITISYAASVASRKHGKSIAWYRTTGDARFASPAPSRATSFGRARAVPVRRTPPSPFRLHEGVGVLVARWPVGWRSVDTENRLSIIGVMAPVRGVPREPSQLVVEIFRAPFET